MKSSLVLALALAATFMAQAEPSLPHLRSHGTATQLIVDGQPFLIRGGEIGNSAATNPATFEHSWPLFHRLNLNTVIVPVYWDLIEPTEGHFEFATVDRLLSQARENHLRLVLLWFGSWKNSMSCYVPAWIKQDPKRFPRAADLNGRPQEILTPFSDENRRIDAEAFATVMRHLHETDGTQHTVILVQVENEIGMIPTARDHSPEANRAFAGPVPAELMNYLAANLDHLTPELKSTWAASGAKRAGTWAEVFGTTPAGEEIFMAWYYAHYTNAVAAAGKKEYPLPMYVNAALIRPGYQPGQYPSAGPLPHLFDVWRAGAPAIDIFSPDIYFGFADWAKRFKPPGNPLFIPETLRGEQGPVNALFAYGALDAIGFSPFGIDSIHDAEAGPLAASYDLVAQLEPLIVAHQGDGSMAGFLPAGTEQRQPQQVRLGRYVLAAKFETTRPSSELADGAEAKAPEKPAATLPSGGLVIALGPDEFLFAGTGITVTFATNEPNETVGLLSAEEGTFVNGSWQNTLWLSGDETNQGRQIRLEPGRFSIQRVKLYRY